ncbi:MAG: DUF4135 domain-containing protein [Gammaproteobacteria bacterium]|nr:DUF4135 domain-containing protein [Gammaproteobacteria bacterium]
MKTEDDLILQWAARAAAPQERTGCAGFRPRRRQTPAVVEDRRKCWIEAATGGDAGQFRELLARRGMDERQWLAGLQDFEVADANALPQWADDLRAHFARAGDNPPDSRAGGFSFWSDAARRDVDAALREHGLDSLFRDEARDGFIDYLVSRLASVNNQAWTHLLSQSARAGHAGDHSADHAGDGRPLREAWIYCFNRYPVLAKLCAVLYRDWLTGCRELIARLAEDRELIVRSFFNGGDPGAVVKVRCGAGDPHDNSRSVALLTFERGALVYKPKQLRLTAALNRLLHDLSQMSDDGIALTSPLFVDRGAYGWEAFAAPHPCRNLREVAVFYSRLGAWLQLLEVLSGIDYWFDNLLACGASPVFIDHELVTQPPLTDSPILAAFGNFRSRYMRLALTGILPFLMPGHARREMTDISCVAPPGWHRSPLRRATRAGADGRTQADADEDGPHNTRISAEGFLEWKEERHAVRCDGRFHDVSGYMESFVGGYAGMGKLLCTPPAREAFERFFGRIRDARLRRILLDTWSCYQTTDYLTAPQMLGDGVRYEIGLETLWSSFPARETALVENAIHDFRHCDVPFFWAAPGSRDLHGLSGEPARDYFDVDAVSHARENLHALDEDAISDGCDAVYSLFSVRPDHPRRRIAWPARGAQPPAGGWLDAAVAIGDRLIAAAETETQDGNPDRRAATGFNGGRIHNDAETRDGNLDWHGITWWPFYGARGFTLVGRDLAGIGGIGVYLARLYQATDELRFADHAERILHGLRDTEDVTYIGGAVHGPASRLIAALHISEALGVAVETDWMEEAVRRPPDWSVKNFPVGNLLDYSAGLSGLLCALGFVNARVENAAFARARAREIAGELRGVLPPDLPVQLAAFSDPEPALLPGVWRAGQLACSLWPDLTGDIAAHFRRRAAPQRTGDLMAELLLAQRFGESAGFDPLASAMEFVNTPQTTTSGCLAQLWVALSACIAEPAAMEKALETGSLLFAVFNREGRWFADEWAGDAHLPTALDGLSSLGLALLALHGSAPVLPPWLVDCGLR